MRFDQCTETCTTDCGHCKGRPVAALRADNERLARRLAGRFEEAETLRAEVASLRQQLDAARGRWQQMREALAIPDDWEPYIEPEEARIAAYVKAKASDAEHQRGKQRALVDLLSAAEADRDRLLVVYRAAEAWREYAGSDQSAEEAALIAAVDSYRAGAPAEAPDGERA